MLVVKALLSYPLPYYAAVEVLEQTVFTGPVGGVGSLLQTKTHSHGNLSSSQSSVSSLCSEGHVESKLNGAVVTEPTKNRKLLKIKTQEHKEFNFPTCYTPEGSVQLWAYALRSALILGTLVMAVCIPHFALLMGLTGSLTGASLAFLLPTLFHLQMRWKTLKLRQILLNVFILILGVVVSTSGIYHSIQGLYYAYHPRTHPVPMNLQSDMISHGILGATNATEDNGMTLFNEIPSLN